MLFQSFNNFFQFFSLSYFHTPILDSSLLVVVELVTTPHSEGSLAWSGGAGEVSLGGVESTATFHQWPAIVGSW